MGKNLKRAASAILCFACFMSQLFPVIAISKNQNTSGDVLSEFSNGEVAILPGMICDKINSWENFYLDIPNENILYEFRYLTGQKDIPGKRLGGWAQNLCGYEANEWISGFCRLYALTGNEKFKNKACELMDGWYDCFCQKSESLMWYNSHYAARRWLEAALDCYTYLNKENALVIFETIYNWCKTTLTCDNAFGDNSTEWYTLGKPFYTAYNITGNQEYLTYAKKFDYDKYWKLFSDKETINPFAYQVEKGLNTESYHIISHVNSFNSAAEALRVSDRPNYLEEMENFYYFLDNYQCYSSGNMGSGLEWALPVEKILDDLNSNHYHSETGSTVCYNEYALNLIKLSGNAEAGKWLEKLIYNDVCAVLNPKPTSTDNYIFQSYHDYNLSGGSKKYGWRNQDLEWTSCASTMPLEIAQIMRGIYFHDNASVYVNLYTPSKLSWQRNNNEISVIQQSDYCETGNINVIINSKKRERFNVSLRNPLNDGSIPDVFVNGEKQNITIDNGWIVISKYWGKSDTISISQNQKVTLKYFSDSNYASLMVGNIVMGITAGSSDNILNSEWYETDSWEKTGKMEFKLKSDNSVIIKPYYMYGENEKYYIYLNHCSNKIDEKSFETTFGNDLNFNLNWQNDGFEIKNGYLSSTKNWSGIVCNKGEYEDYIIELSANNNLRVAFACNDIWNDRWFIEFDFDGAFLLYNNNDTLISSTNVKLSRGTFSDICIAVTPHKISASINGNIQFTYDCNVSKKGKVGIVSTVYDVSVDYFKIIPNVRNKYFNDDFNDSNKIMTDWSGKGFSVANGKLNGNKGFNGIIFNECYDNFIINATLNNNVRIVFLADKQSGLWLSKRYYVELDFLGAVYLRNGNDETLAAKQITQLVAGNSVKLKISVYEQTVRVYVNNFEVLHYENLENYGGQIGIITTDCDVSFDNLSISEFPIGDISGNGDIDVRDLIIVKKYYLLYTIPIDFSKRINILNKDMAGSLVFLKKLILGVE